MKKQSGKTSIISIISTIILLIILGITFNYFKASYYNSFEKAVTTQAKSDFTRDKKVTCSKDSSYKIENKELNDATFYKEIDVEPNTPYKISCMVKTENVVCENENEDGGAVIGILDTTEYSEPIKGTNEWQKVEYMFNSKNREKVKISFRLGGNNANCTGTAWFTDLKVEKGTKRTDTNWNVGCFIIKNIDVNIDGKEYKLITNLEDVENVRLNLARYKETCYEFSNKKLNVNYEMIEITEPLTRISYSDEHGYYFDYSDVKDLVYKTAVEKEFDHIIVVARMENEAGTLTIPIKDNWIGLGSMDMYGIGYSLIRINKNANVYNYKYGITNQAPEEVYVHEFLHTLERNIIERGYTIPALHDYEKYGYTVKPIEGLNQWYKDYMRKEILDKTTNTYIGLAQEAYSTQPANSSNFKYPIDIEFNKEPQNFFEDILTIIDAIKHRF